MDYDSLNEKYNILEDRISNRDQIINSNYKEIKNLANEYKRLIKPSTLAWGATGAFLALDIILATAFITFYLMLYYMFLLKLALLFLLYYLIEMLEKILELILKKMLWILKKKMMN